MNKILALIVVLSCQHRLNAQYKTAQIDEIMRKTDNAANAQRYEISPRDAGSPPGSGILFLTRIGSEFAKVEHFDPDVPGLERNAFQKRYIVLFEERAKQFRSVSISGTDGKIISDEIVKSP